MKTIIVIYNGSMMSVWETVAERLNLRNGQVIQTEAHFWEVLTANASFGLSICQHQMQTKDN